MTAGAVQDRLGGNLQQTQAKEERKSDLALSIKVQLPNDLLRQNKNHDIADEVEANHGSVGFLPIDQYTRRHPGLPQRFYRKNGHKVRDDRCDVEPRIREDEQDAKPEEYGSLRQGYEDVNPLDIVRIN